MDVADLSHRGLDVADASSRMHDAEPVFPSATAWPQLVERVAPPPQPLSPAPVIRSKRIVFAGLSAGQLVLVFLGLVALLWAVWATHKIIVVDHRRIVAVRLSGLVGDFVNAEARSGDDPRNLSARTQAYMATLDLLLKKRAATGETVIVAEAVVGESVPDITAEIAEQLARVVKLRSPLAVSPAIGALPVPQGSLQATPQTQALPLSAPLSSNPGPGTGAPVEQPPSQTADPFTSVAPAGGN